MATIWDADVLIWAASQNVHCVGLGSGPHVTGYLLDRVETVPNEVPLENRPS
jgi:hypothetical protein